MRQYKVKSYFILFVFLIWGVTVCAQKEPQFSQYMYNVGSFNPAYVGTVENIDITGLYRSQWVGVEGAPKTMRFGVNMPLNASNGLGFNVVSDALGPANYTFIDIAYSFQVPISDTALWSFGLSAGGSVLGVDFNKGSFEEVNEPLLAENNVNAFYPSIGAGTFVYAENWYVGFSIPNFLSEGLYNDQVAKVVDGAMRLTFIGGLVLDMGDQLRFKPAFLLHTKKGAPTTLDFSTNFLLADVVTLGASYRVNSAISGLAGVQLSPGLFLGYAYDHTNNSFGRSSGASHEIILKFYMGKQRSKRRKKMNDDKPKQVDTPRFF